MSRDLKAGPQTRLDATSFCSNLPPACRAENLASRCAVRLYLTVTNRVTGTWSVPLSGPLEYDSDCIAAYLPLIQFATRAPAQLRAFIGA